MENNFFETAMWWISVVELPALVALFALVWTLTRELSAFGLDVARTYAPAAQVRELELRLTAHLLRIEAKLDATALKAERLTARGDVS
jgi:hypothetical protein